MCAFFTNIFLGSNVIIYYLCNKKSITLKTTSIMIEYLLAHMWQVWAVVALLCLILELSSGDFFIICFSIGAVFAVLTSVLGLSIYWQIFVFALFSLLSVLFIRPIALRYLHKNDPNRASNADALLGRTGRVTENIPADGTGYVQIDGDQWRAVSSTKTAIDKGTSVRVVDRESTIVTVETL